MRSFVDVAEAWLADVARQRRPRTVASYRIALQKFLEAVPEARERWIARPDLVRFRDTRAARVSAHSANRDLKAIKACLAWAWVNELPHPPVPLRKLLLRTPARRDPTLAPEEVARVLEAATVSPRLLVVLKVAHGTGLRLGEILNLTWSDVDFAEGAISVRPKPWWEPKTAAAIRTVYAPEFVHWLEGYRETLRDRGPLDRVAQMDARTGRPGRTASTSSSSGSTAGPGWRDPRTPCATRGRRPHPRGAEAPRALEPSRHARDLRARAARGSQAGSGGPRESAAGLMDRGMRTA